MIIQYVEGNDGTRHAHLSDCGHLVFQLEAGEVWEVELDDDATEDDLLLGVWDDFVDETGASDEEIDNFADMTVFRECLDEAFPSEEDAESSGNAKADAFMDAVENAAWDVQFQVSDDTVQVIAQREYIGPDGIRTNQVLDLIWTGNRLDEAHHLSGLPGDVAKKISSVAGAQKILVEPRPQRKTEKVSSRKVDREQPVKRVLKISLPFDIEEAYDDEIIKAVRGKKLVWWNNTAEDYDSATVIGKNHIKIETGTGGRAILTFCSFETGYRSVALETLVQVK